MTSLKVIDPPVRVTVADGRVIHIKTVGVLKIPVVLQKGTRSMTRVIMIENVYHVPTLSVTLLSVSQLVHAVQVVRFENNEWGVFPDMNEARCFMRRNFTAFTM
jgi:hypothetical protein